MGLEMSKAENYNKKYQSLQKDIPLLDETIHMKDASAELWPIELERVVGIKEMLQDDCKIMSFGQLQECEVFIDRLKNHLRQVKSRSETASKLVASDSVNKLVASDNRRLDISPCRTTEPQLTRPRKEAVPDESLKAVEGPIDGIVPLGNGNEQENQLVIAAPPRPFSANFKIPKLKTETISKSSHIKRPPVRRHTISVEKSRSLPQPPKAKEKKADDAPPIKNSDVQADGIPKLLLKKIGLEDNVWQSNAASKRENDKARFPKRRESIASTRSELDSRKRKIKEDIVLGKDNTHSKSELNLEKKLEPQKPMKKRRATVYCDRPRQAPAEPKVLLSPIHKLRSTTKGNAVAEKVVELPRKTGWKSGSDWYTDARRCYIYKKRLEKIERENEEKAAKMKKLADAEVAQPVVEVEIEKPAAEIVRQSLWVKIPLQILSKQPTNNMPKDLREAIRQSIEVDKDADSPEESVAAKSSENVADIAPTIKAETESEDIAISATEFVEVKMENNDFVDENSKDETTEISKEEIIQLFNNLKIEAEKNEASSTNANKGQGNRTTLQVKQELIDNALEGGNNVPPASKEIEVMDILKPYQIKIEIESVCSEDAGGDDTNPNELSEMYNAEELEESTPHIPSSIANKGHAHCIYSGHWEALRRNNLCLRPWMERFTEKLPLYTNIMVLEDNIKLLYKCMGMSCAFATNTASEFQKHFEFHSMGRVCPDTLFNCAYCKHKGLTKEELTGHIHNEHGNCAFQCRHCFYRSCAETNVVTHQKIFHKSVPRKVLVCNAYPMHIDQLMGTLEKCRNKHVPPIVCSVCSLHFYVWEFFMDHIETHYVNSQTCFICSKILPKSDIVSHYEKHYIGLFQCVYCLFGSNSRVNMRCHLSVVHASKQPYLAVRVYKRTVDDVKTPNKNSVHSTVCTFFPEKNSEHENST